MGSAKVADVPTANMSAAEEAGGDGGSGPAGWGQASMPPQNIRCFTPCVSMPPSRAFTRMADAVTVNAPI